MLCFLGVDTPLENRLSSFRGRCRRSEWLESYSVPGLTLVQLCHHPVRVRK